MILIGWKSWCEVVGGITPKTLRKAFQEHPITFQNFHGKPAIARNDLIDWFKKSFPEKKFKKLG